jgi:hypothetical protein
VEKVMKGVNPLGLVAACFLAFLVAKAISYTTVGSLPAPPQPPAAAVQMPAAPPPPAPDVKTGYDPGLIALGKEIFAKAVARYSPQSTYFDVWGSGYPEAVAALFMPEKVWDRLPAEKRKALVVLVQAEIPNIRRDPDKYIGFSKDTPLYQRLRTNVEQIADGHYVVFTTVRSDHTWIRGKVVAEWKQGAAEL